MCARALVIHTQLTSTVWPVKYVLKFGVVDPLFTYKIVDNIKYKLKIWCCRPL